MRHFGGSVVFALGMLASACAHGGAPRPDAPRKAALPPQDPTARLIAEADSHLASGMAEIKEGHLNKAREELDRAVDVYLGAPGGAYATARLGEAYRRTLEEIHIRELEALAAGDGFTEALPEPASIDEVGEIAMTDEPPSDEVRRTSEEAVRGEANDLPIELNDSVLACIDLYRGRLRDWFTAALARGGRYLPQIRATFAEEGIPKDLAYVALVESAFKPAALSRAKAKGVWQFISSTGKRYGLSQDWWVDERSDPEKATRAAARYLKELHQMFGDWNLALAGYNAGEKKVLRGVDRYGTTDFWKLRTTRAFRRETKNYVPMIHAAIIVAKAPERYGFEVEPETTPEFETVPIEGAVDLRLIAECAQTSIDDVRLLNPELRRLATPAGRSFDLKLPAGAGAVLRQCLESVPPEKRVRFRTHTVSRGETLGAIARRYGTSSRNIAEANGISLYRRLSVGTGLIIPIDPRVKPVPAPRVTAERRPAPDLPSVFEGTVRISYRIKPGDTLSTIATQYGTTVRELQAWNRLRGTRIAAGTTLTIYTSRKF